jgi:DNA-binding CsgD family transcriptional regulator
MKVSPPLIKSERQLQILKLASAGLTDKEIAAQTGLSISTLRTYWDRLKYRYQCKNRAELIATVQKKLITEEFVSQALDALPMFVWKMGPCGNVQYCNSWFGKQSIAETERNNGSNLPVGASENNQDRNQEHLEGVEQFMLGEMRERYQKRWKEACRQGQALEQSVSLTFGAGTTALYRICVVPVLGKQSEILHWLGYGRALEGDPDAPVAAILNLLIA